MPPAEIETICRRIKELGLHFGQAFIMGGEPALWKHLEDGCRVIRESKAFNRIHIYSNCKKPEPLIALLDRGLADVVETQAVNGNAAGIRKVREKHPTHMNVANQDVHRVHPIKPVEGALPALCGCDQITVFGGKVYSCPGAYHNTVRMGWSLDEPKLWMGVEEDWYTHFSQMDRYNIPACTVCLANGKIWNKTEIGNRVGELK